MKYRKVYKKKFVKKYKKKPTLSRQLLRIADPKQYSNADAKSLVHNDSWIISPTQFLGQGTAVGQRIGDSVYLQSLQMSGYLTSSALANAACKYRFIVFWSNQQYAASAWQLNIVAPSTLAQPGTAPLNQGPNLIVNPRAITVLADFVMDINCNVSGAGELKSYNVTIPLNQNFNYNTPGGVYGKTKNLYVWMTSIIYGGTGGTSSSGSMQNSFNLKFKDP